MSEPVIVTVRDVAMRHEPVRWAFAEERRDEIAANWLRLTAEKPALFNGRILIMHRWTIDGDLFAGAYHEADYAAFLAWRDFGFPDPPRRNGFGMAALRSADDAFLLGEMAPHTANPGSVYFAAGTPDVGDIVGDTVDIAGNIFRELAEETGVTAAEVTAGEGYTLVHDGPRTAIMKPVRSSLPAEALKARIEAHLASEAQPELARMHVIRCFADCAPLTMPVFQKAYLRHALAG